MIEKMLVPLMMVRNAGTFGGKTRLQKLTCLLEAALAPLGRRVGYAYQQYHYGPFSFELAKIVDQLVAQNLLQESRQVLSTGHELVSYWLTPSGDTFVRMFVERDPRLRELEESVVTIVGQNLHVPLEELVRRAYSAYHSFASPATPVAPVG